MTNMKDLFGDWWAQRFEAAEQNKLITLRHHPVYSQLVIANYTPETAYRGAWDAVTSASRGLIFDSITGHVHARPFDKFFNYGQAGAPEIGLDDLVVPVNKFDGSLGIAYKNFDGVFEIATRGSFASTQAVHATEWLHKPENRETYIMCQQSWGMDITPLFEIIYPENRIVLDYGNEDYLQLLGWRYNDTGEFEVNPLFKAPTLTFREVLAIPPRKNAEGFVVWLDRHNAVKIKQDDYVALHAVVTGLNEKSVWRAVREGMPAFGEFLAKLPDELQPWAKKVGSDLAHAYGSWVSILDEWYLIATDVAWGYTDQEADSIPRKEFALAVQDHVPAEYRGFMFSIADGKDYSDNIWSMLEPKGKGSRPSNAIADEE